MVPNLTRPRESHCSALALWSPFICPSMILLTSAMHEKQCPLPLPCHCHLKRDGKGAGPRPTKRLISRYAKTRNPSCILNRISQSCIARDDMRFDFAFVPNVTKKFSLLSAGELEANPCIFRCHNHSQHRKQNQPCPEEHCWQQPRPVSQRRPSSLLQRPYLPLRRCRIPARRGECENELCRPARAA